MEPGAHGQQEASTTSSMQRAESIASELNDALRYGQREKVLELLENGADVNSKVEFGWTPLHSAVQSGDKEMVQSSAFMHVCITGRCKPRCENSDSAALQQSPPGACHCAAHPSKAAVLPGLGVSAGSRLWGCHGSAFPCSHWHK